MIITLIFVFALGGKKTPKSKRQLQPHSNALTPQYQNTPASYFPMPVMQVIRTVHVPVGVPVEVQGPKTLQSRVLDDDMLRGIYFFMFKETHGFVETQPSKDGRFHHILSLDAEFITVLDSENTKRSAVYKVALVSSTGMILVNKYVQLPDKTLLAPSCSERDVVEPIDDIMRKTELGDSLEDIQNLLTQHISQETILIVHDGRGDLKSLKLLHKNLVDISVELSLEDGVTREEFYNLGKFNRKALRHQCKDIGLNIQEGIHDPVEDSMGTLEVMAHHLSEHERQIYRFKENMLLDYQKSKEEIQNTVLNRKQKKSQTVMWLPPQDRKSKASSFSESNDLFRPRSQSASLPSEATPSSPRAPPSETSDSTERPEIDLSQSSPASLKKLPPVPDEAPPPPPIPDQAPPPPTEIQQSKRNRWNRRIQKVQEAEIPPPPPEKTAIHKYAVECGVAEDELTWLDDESIWNILVHRNLENTTS